MNALAQYLAAHAQPGGPVDLVTGFVITWTAPGNNSISVLGATIPNVCALSGVTLTAGDTVALLLRAGTYLAIGKVV